MPEEFKDLQENGFEDFSNWKKKEIDSLRQIIYLQINQCRSELSKELKKGGDYNVQTPKGIMPLHFSDQREIIINSIQTLYDLMLWFFDEEADTNIKSIGTKIDNAEEDYLEKYINSEWYKPYKERAKLSREIQIGPESDVGKKIESRLENYIVELYRQLFRELILLFKRKNELTGKRTAGV